MEYNSSKIRDYYFSTKKLAKFFYFMLIFGAIFSILVVGIIHGSPDAIFWLFVAIITLIFGSLGVIFWRISKPHLEASKVIFSISNKIMPDKMPIPSDKKYAKSGFGEILKFIFAFDHIESSPQKISHQDSDSLPEILKNSGVGFAVINSKNEVVFSNDFSVDFSKIRKDKMTEILSWLENVRKSKIRSSKIWERVSNIFEKTDEQKLYDIAVFFEKQFEQDAVFFFIDKTAIYENDESDLNFIAFAAHEIRGPITIIRGYLDILSMELETTLSDTQKELFTRLIVSSNKLNGYINNILNVAKLDQNRLSFSTKECTITEIFDSISEDISVRASSQNRELQIDLPHELPSVSADIYGASEVLTNLVDNAIKYSNDGGLVKIYADSDENFVNIHVQDFGIGMADNILKNLFQKFYRSHRSRESVAGSGIGLYISKSIMELIGGKISVSSREGKGSTFTVSFSIFEKSSQKRYKTKNIQITNHGKIF